MNLLADKKLFLLDMDGTLYLGDQLFDGAAEFLQAVRRRGGRYVFLTNNSSRGTEAYIAKLARMGIAAQPEDFLTSADAAIAYLKKTYADALYYVCGTRSLKDQLRAAGLRVTDTLTEDITVLLLGYDTELTYQKLEDCCILLGRNVDYIATHPDLVCPTRYGFALKCCTQPAAAARRSLESRSRRWSIWRWSALAVKRRRPASSATGYTRTLPAAKTPALIRCLFCPARAWNPTVRSSAYSRPGRCRIFALYWRSFRRKNAPQSSRLPSQTQTRRSGPRLRACQKMLF